MTCALRMAPGLDLHATTVRLLPDVIEGLQALAAQLGLSLNAYLNMHFRQTLRGVGVAAEPAHRGDIQARAGATTVEVKAPLVVQVSEDVHAPAPPPISSSPSAPPGEVDLARLEERRRALAVGIDLDDPSLDAPAKPKAAAKPSPSEDAEPADFLSAWGARMGAMIEEDSEETYARRSREAERERAEAEAERELEARREAHRKLGVLEDPHKAFEGRLVRLRLLLGGTQLAHDLVRGEREKFQAERLAIIQEARSGKVPGWERTRQAAPFHGPNLVGKNGEG